MSPPTATRARPRIPSAARRVRRRSSPARACCRRTTAASSCSRTMSSPSKCRRTPMPTTRRTPLPTPSRCPERETKKPPQSMPCGGFCLKQDVHVLRTGKEKQPAAGDVFLRWVQTQYSIAPRALQGKIQAPEKFRMLPQGTGFCLFLSS